MPRTRNIVTIACILAATAPAAATTIYDIQTGAVPEHTEVQLEDVVVVAVRDNGFFVAEAPFGAYRGIWVFTGIDGGEPDVEAGDLVAVAGEYYEYAGMSEVDATGGAVTVTGAGIAPPPIPVQFDYWDFERFLEQAEAYESCLIRQDYCMMVTDMPDAWSEWWASAILGGPWYPAAFGLCFVGYWYDASTVALGDFYAEVTGIIVYRFGKFLLAPLADGISVVDGCPLSEESTTFGTAKAIYR